MKLPMINKKIFIGTFALAVVTSLPLAVQAQTTYTENFTGVATNNPWYFINGACLTAGAASGTTSPGQIPACVGLPYYPSKGDNILVGGNTGKLPDDPTVGGALRFTNGNLFTNGNPGGYNQNGAILSNFNFPTSNGIQVTFTTETYRGNSAGSSVADGADGISFFLQSVDNGQVADIGAFGGSLGYTCSNTNNDGTLRASGQPRGYDGLIGGYIGLGIDEYGNFWNAQDNTSSGPSYQGNRIAMRGAGSTAWAYLNKAYPSQYPATLTFPQRASSVQQACQNGYVYDWSAVGTWNNNGHLVNGSPAAEPDPTQPWQNSLQSNATTPLTNYQIIPNASAVLGSTINIANESALYRGPGGQLGASYGVPITYNLTITPAGLLSLSYSYNGGSYQPVITGQDITVANGALPNNVRFGFAGSTGGGTNIHEIMCFQAQPASQTAASAGVNQKQSAKVQVGSQVYFAFYNANNWPGSLTSLNLEPSPADPTTLIIAPTANWDASCVLTGVTAGQTCAATGISGPVAAEAPASRTILTWDTVKLKGTSFEWNSLPGAEQSALDLNDPMPITPLRLNYLRGDRSNELNPLGVGLYRARTSVLGDIIDSSPTWVGPPQAGYPALWTDLYPNGGLMPAPTPPENKGGAQSYPSFVAAQQTRTNVVYAGANDGLLHGFRSGSFDTSNNYVATYNDGLEVMAYMPGYIVNTINSSTTPSDNYSNPQYGHHFDVDATPATGDLFYGNQWHTWLVGGLGPGGNSIFALDITNPGSGNGDNFSEGSPQATVIGEWSTTTVTCANVGACGNNLGQTYGTPQIRRFHNGDWGFIVGNGFGSATGDAGIYVVTVDSASGTLTWYYLSAGQAGNSDGIAYPSAADLDNDRITDYVYAGDLLGNIWRFDLTDSDPTKWQVTSGGPLFTTSAGQPISTKPFYAIDNTGPIPRLLIEFGTGRATPMTDTSAALYSTGQQALYGIWDWNLTAWNAKSAVVFASLPTTTAAATLGALKLQKITGSYNAALTGIGSSFRTVSNYAVCYADVSGCTNMGWYLLLPPPGPSDPNNSNSPTVAEQVLFAPALISGVFVVNTTVPPTNSPTTCSSTAATSWTMALDPTSGGALSSSFFQYTSGKFINITATNAAGQPIGEQGVSGVSNLGTGTPTAVTLNGQQYLVSSPVTGPGNTPPAGVCANSGGCVPKYSHNNVQAKRVTWIQRR
jgi:type IV pilus assembly protein PilY1